jgi:hypothetical protein
MSVDRINRILVIVDPSAKGRQSAVDKGMILARCLGASVELLICDTASAEDDLVRPHADKTAPSNTQLLDLLDELAASGRMAGVDVKTHLIYCNSLHDSLLDFIRGSTAGLVIKDTHYHSFAKRTLLRNTDWYLARGWPRPFVADGKPDLEPTTHHHGGGRSESHDREIRRIESAHSALGRITCRTTDRRFARNSLLHSDRICERGCRRQSEYES